jgi:murein L,D-transpeptidase YafK
VKRAFWLSSGALLALVALLGVANVTSKPLPLGVTADRVVIEKAARRLTLWRGGQVLKEYRVALGRQPVGDKVQRGDNRTPEGVFVIDSRNANSSFHRALHLSYPDPAHAARAKQLGVDPGGDIMIHGIRNGLGWIGSLHRVMDWTEGCVALTNPEIDEVWRAVPDGTSVEIRP